MNTPDNTPAKPPRPLLAIVLLFTVPILLGVMISPFVFNFFRDLGETTDAYSKLTDARFERVTTRCVMIVAALILYPVIRMTGLLPQVKSGLTGSPDRYRDLGISILVGAVSMSLLFLAGWYFDAFAISPKLNGFGAFIKKFSGFLVGAAFIGLFEEIFFRGFVFGSLRIRLGFPVALVVSSIIFSGIHFFRPLYPVEIIEAEWSSGFALIPHMFARFVWPNDTLFAATLFVMGLTLATYYHKRGNLYFIMGLHGGWVLAMQTGAYLFNRNRDTLPLLYGSSDFASKGVLALVVVCLFYVSALLIPSRTGGRRDGNR